MEAKVAPGPLGPDEMETLTEAYCFGRYAALLNQGRTPAQARGESGVSEAEMQALFAWAGGVRLAEGMLSSLLAGSMWVTGMDGGEPLLMLSPQGVQEAEALVKELQTTAPGEEELARIIQAGNTVWLHGATSYRKSTLTARVLALVDAESDAEARAAGLCEGPQSALSVPLRAEVPGESGPGPEMEEPPDAGQ